MADQRKTEREQPPRTSSDEERIRSIADQENDLDEEIDFDEDDTDEEEESRP